MKSDRRLRGALVAAAAWEGILAGAGVVDLLVHLPARHRLGAPAWAEYALAAYQGRARVVFPALGIGGALLAGGAFALALRRHATRGTCALLGVAIAAQLAGMAFALRAIPVLDGIARHRGDAGALLPLANRFAGLQTARVLFVEITFGALLAALWRASRDPASGREERQLRAVAMAVTVWASILGGAAVPLALVHLPARHRIGSVAFARYARATDLGPGKWLYPVLGIGEFTVVAAAYLLARRRRASPTMRRRLATATGLAALVLAATAGAAPAMLRVGHTADREEALAPLLDRFDAFSLPRAVFLYGTYVVLLSSWTAREDSG